MAALYQLIKDTQTVINTLRAPDRSRYPELDSYTRDELYADCFGGGGLYLAARMARTLSLHAGDSVLDLGCGKGETSIFLARHFGVKVVALDLWTSATFLNEKFTQRGYGGRIVPLNLDVTHALPFAENTFVAIFCMNSFNFYGAERMVRINQLPRGLDDLEEIVPHNVHVVLLPKCESRDQIVQVNEKIRSIQERRNLSGDIYLMPIIESALGVIRAYEIATAADNVVAVALGLEDYCADMGVRRTTEGAESLYAKSHLVNVCRAAGVQAIDSVFSDFQDEGALRKIVLQSKSLGFEGIGCIHPSQIRPVHESFAPTDKEISKAKEIVFLFEQAEEKGLGVVALGSKMIDPPVVNRALKLVDRAKAMGLL